MLVPRRVILASALVTSLSACGLRLDTPPDIPTPAPIDTLRNDIAQLLATTITSTAEEAQRVTELSQAIGPVWSPPSGYPVPGTTTATSPPPASADSPASANPPASAHSTTAGAAEQPLPYAEAMARIAQQVFSSSVNLTVPLGPVLADVAVGASLFALDAHSPAITRALETLRERVDDSELPGAGSGAGSATTTSAASQEAGDGAAGGQAVPQPDDLARACFQASYGYELAGVHFAVKSAERNQILTRISQLDRTAEGANQLVRANGEQPARNQPAWDLTIKPVDAASAKQLITELEAAVASATIAAFTAATSAPTWGMWWLWQSAAARRELIGTQALRYQLATPTPQDSPRSSKRKVS